MASKTNVQLVKFLEKIENLPTQYIMGGFGRTLTQSMIDYSIKVAKNPHTIKYQNTIKKGIGKHAVDCVGIIKWFMWERSNGVTYNVPKGSDQNVGMMYRSTTEKGQLEIMPDLPGLLVFTKGLTHVGVYVGKNEKGEREYIEATPAFGAWGVIRTNDKMRTWETWGRYHLIDYVEPIKEVPETPTTEDKGTLKEGAIVNWSGRLHRDSFGNVPSKTDYKNRTGVISILRLNNPYGVHIKGIGWIKPSQINSIEPNDNVYHIVKKGDTLYDIGKKYGVLWNVIYRNNKSIIGNRPSFIKPGQKLFIK